MIRIIIGIVIGVALFASLAQAEEPKTVTPKEFVETVVAVPGKVSTHLQNERTEASRNRFGYTPRFRRSIK